jgi:hypothetical protein
MTLLLPTLPSLATAFLVDPQPSLEARQRAAQVRASMLTKDWSWLMEGVGYHANLASDRRWEILLGLARWTVAAPDLDILFSRFQVLREASSFNSGNPLGNVQCQSWWAVVDHAGKKPSKIDVGPGNVANEYRGQEDCCILPAWGRRPKQQGRSRILWVHELGERLWSWDTRKGRPARVLVSYLRGKPTGSFEIREDYAL